MILAAGRGSRMRPLTDTQPKPLLPVAGKALIDYHLEKLAAAGVTRVVINHAWLGEQLEAHVGDGTAWGLQVVWSPEPEGGLETAGGIVQALDALGDKPFWVINADVWTDYDFRQLPTNLGSDLGHLVLVPSPPHNAAGDFGLQEDRVVQNAQPGLTFSGISLLHPALFNGLEVSKYPLKPLFENALSNQQLSGERYDGRWCDVGTPQRLRQLEEELSGGGHGMG
ncbi:N-acetylmuramate alpha-1-phosphate uridylyltransferase MurU [Aliidiomarina sp. Khilg15.8]